MSKNMPLLKDSRNGASVPSRGDVAIGLQTVLHDKVSYKELR